MKAFSEAFQSKEEWQGVHRHSSLHTHFRAKFGHEKEVLGTQKSLLAGGNRLTFDARYLLDF